MRRHCALALKINAFTDVTESGCNSRTPFAEDERRQHQLNEPLLASSSERWHPCRSADDVANAGPEVSVDTVGVHLAKPVRHQNLRPLTDEILRLPTKEVFHPGVGVDDATVSDDDRVVQGIQHTQRGIRCILAPKPFPLRRSFKVHGKAPVP